MIDSAGILSFWDQFWQTILPLFVASICGGLVGLEREQANRPAGLRTHVLVCVGSALIMQVSLAMAHLAGEGLVNGDPGRIAAQVVSGIGFLGAGTIMREGVNIRGLTTAASLWVVAGVGLAVGANLYLPAIATSVLVIITLNCMARFEHHFTNKGGLHALVLQVADTPGRLGALGAVCGRQGASIKGIELRPGAISGTVEIHLRLSMPGRQDASELITDLMATEGVLSVTEEDSTTATARGVRTI